MNNPIRPVMAFALLIALQACTSLNMEPVKPWQRGILAQEEMQLVPDPIESFADQHIYFSREASTGGREIGGGGCGCN